MQALLLGRRSEHFGADGLGHLRGELLDEFLEEGGEGFVGALQLVFGVGEERFEVLIGCRHAVDEIFENESESDRTR